jgi:hypothetical protein
VKFKLTSSEEKYLLVFFVTIKNMLKTVMIRKHYLTLLQGFDRLNNWSLLCSIVIDSSSVASDLGKADVD